MLWSGRTSGPHHTSHWDTSAPSKMEALPVEVWLQVLSYAIAGHPTPISSVAIVHSSWAEIIIPITRKYLIFAHLSQIIRFSQRYQVNDLLQHKSRLIDQAPGTIDSNSKPSTALYNNPVPSPSSISFLPSITTTDVNLFKHIDIMFRSCSSLTKLHLVDMRINSHVKGADAVYDALCQINPIKFSWGSPDPVHHFSISIVSNATGPLSRAISRWSNLRHLRLCNMDLAERGWELVRCFSQDSHRNIQTIYIGQTVQMEPIFAAAIPLMLPHLVNLSLVDVYLGSIWGKRLRTEDIKSAVCAKGWDWNSLSGIISCGVERERIIGGDRGF